MKKVFTLLMAMTMVIGFAGIAAADCFNCAGTAGNIARGCESGQDYCDPFDFEEPSDYCGSKLEENRAVFKICDCITDGDFETVIAGDTIDISMEILVNGEDGDNGVYWAEYVGTVYNDEDMDDDYAEEAWIDHNNPIDLELFENQDDACDDTDGKDAGFDGRYEYLLADGSFGYPNTYNGDEEDNECSVEEENRVVKLQLADRTNPHGYVVDMDDELEGNATWAIDIPEMRVDPSRVNAGDQVWVRICLLLDCAGICSEDVVCCCDVYIGELCCAYDSASGTGLIYPYFPPANTTAWNLLGMTITNLSAIDGTATITMYETDGSVGTVEVEIGGNEIYLRTINQLIAEMTGTGLGDSISYLTVTTDFPASGFAMIADTIDGASMGYLPIQNWETDLAGFVQDMGGLIPRD